MRSWDQLVDNHIRSCEARGLSQAMLGGRRRELERWGAWLKRQRPKPKVENVDSDLILGYLRARTAFHSKASVQSIMSHMRTMGEYLAMEGIWHQNPLRWMRGPKLDPRRISPRRIDREHLGKLFVAAAEVPQEYQRHLWLTILICLYATGMRRGELVRLNLADWSSADRTIRIDSTKVGLERLVPVPESVAAYIDAYLPHRQNLLLKNGGREQSALFVNRDGLRIDGNYASRAIHRVAKRAKVPLVTIHQFRHTCASDLLEEGLGLAEVQRVLGHACIVTTVRYAHVADPARRQAVALHPINSFLGSSSTQEVRDVAS